jgi:hypothetical protein
MTALLHTTILDMLWWEFHKFQKNERRLDGVCYVFDKDVLDSENETKFLGYDMHLILNFWTWIWKQGYIWSSNDFSIGTSQQWKFSLVVFYNIWNKSTYLCNSMCVNVQISTSGKCKF